MDKYYLITGYNTEASGAAYLTYAQVLSSTGVIVTSIPKNNISFAIPRVNWVMGAQFDSYTEEDNSGSYALYNDNVYLCLSNNAKNVKNVINSSNYAPTHASGKVKKPDGYTWEFLYKLTSSVTTLSNVNFIPAPSSYGLKALLVNQEIDVIDCSGGSTGTCALYLTQNGGTYASLIYSGLTGCSECSTIAEETTKTDLLWTRFYEPSESVPSSISLFNYTASLENAIASGKINSKLNFEAKTYENAKLSGISAGAILSANINLAAISALEVTDGVSADTYLKILSSENAISLTGGTGSSGGTGASVVFITSVVDAYYDKIIGINLTAGGSDYTSELVSVLLPGITLTLKRTALISNIDLIGSPPSLTFHKINSIFDVASQNSIGEDRVVNIINAKPDAFTTANYYGIVKADAGKTTLSEICPSKLPIFPLTSSGATFNKEIKNINFIQSINNTEKQRR